MNEQYKTRRRDFFFVKDLWTIKEERGQVATVHQAVIVLPAKSYTV